MTKIDLAEAIQDAADMTKREALDALEGLIEIIKATLETGEPLKISNFGTFEVKQKHERVGRNPQTGESIIIIPRQVVTFKPSKLLRQGINDVCNLTMSKPLKKGRRPKRGTAPVRPMCRLDPGLTTRAARLRRLTPALILRDSRPGLKAGFAGETYPM